MVSISHNGAMRRHVGSFSEATSSTPRHSALNNEAAEIAKDVGRLVGLGADSRSGRRRRRHRRLHGFLKSKKKCSVYIVLSRVGLKERRKDSSYVYFISIVSRDVFAKLLKKERKKVRSARKLKKVHVWGKVLQGHGRRPKANATLAARLFLKADWP